MRIVVAFFKRRSRHGKVEKSITPLSLVWCLRALTPLGVGRSEVLWYVYRRSMWNFSSRQILSTSKGCLLAWSESIMFCHVIYYTIS